MTTTTKRSGSLALQNKIYHLASELSLHKVSCRQGGKDLMIELHLKEFHVF